MHQSVAYQAGLHQLCMKLSHRPNQAAWLLCCPLLLRAVFICSYRRDVRVDMTQVFLAGWYKLSVHGEREREEKRKFLPQNVYLRRSILGSVDVTISDVCFVGFER